MGLENKTTRDLDCHIYKIGDDNVCVWGGYPLKAVDGTHGNGDLHTGLIVASSRALPWESGDLNPADAKRSLTEHYFNEMLNNSGLGWKAQRG